MATENKNLSQYDKKIIPNAESLRFGIITSQWNEQVTYGMRNGAIETLKDCGAIDDNILLWEVGIAQLNAEQSKVPIIFCVLTDNTFQQSLDRSGGKLGNKGVEAAITAIKMAVLGK